MFYRNAYGVELGEAGYSEKYKGPPVLPAETKPGATYVAEIIGWREGKTDWSVNTRVLDADGHAIINPNWQVALWWPDADKPGARPNRTYSTKYRIASTYSLEEALGGIEIRSADAYVNDEGGPFVMWLDGPDIESPMWRVGWAGNHFYTGPYLRVRRKDGAPTVPPVVPPPSGNSDLDRLASYFSTAKTASEAGLDLIDRIRRNVP